MSNYKYFLSGSPVTFLTPKETWISDFTNQLDNEFYNASTVHTIQEETYFSSGSFQSVDVRINRAIDSQTGQKLSDDFKTLLFKSDHAVSSEGDKYYFSNNYWITVNTNSEKSLVNSAVVRRCNNVLRWRTEDGVDYSEHCIIDYKIATPQNKSMTDPVIPEGTIKIITVLNSKTATIKENQRFLFGRPGSYQCYVVYGGGINNFMNSQTTVDTSARLLELSVGKSFVNEQTDNILLGIADYYKYSPSGSTTVNSIRITPVSGSIIEGETETYTVNLMSGSAVLSDAFTFEVSGSSVIPVANYEFTVIDDNNFSVENIEKYLEDPLIITCTSGSNFRNFEVYLKGAW